MNPVPPEVARRSAALDDEALLAECEESFFIGGGPGGQHRNKTESAVRLVHRPTGLVITATERRSQLQNRHAALERLRSELVERSYVAPPRRPTKPTRSSKRRRVEAKKRIGDKKRSRSGRWD